VLRSKTVGYKLMLNTKEYYEIDLLERIRSCVISQTTLVLIRSIIKGWMAVLTGY